MRITVPKRAHYYAGTECPECGNAQFDKIEDNGCTGDMAGFRCQECDCQWDAEQFS